LLAAWPSLTFRAWTTKRLCVRLGWLQRRVVIKVATSPSLKIRVMRIPGGMNVPELLAPVLLGTVTFDAS
jgi:hypothetical protein